MNKQQLRILLAKGKLEKTLQHLLKQCVQLGDHELHTTAVLLSSDYKSYEQAQIRGTSSVSKLRTQRNQILVGALDVIDDFPEIQPTQTKTKGVPEHKFKEYLLWLLLGGKMFLLFWLVFMWYTGGFLNKELFETIQFIAPVFVTYLSIILTEFLRLRNKTFTSKRTIPRSFVRVSTLLIVIYIVAFAVGITFYPWGKIDFETMNTWLAIVESVLGVYVAIIIFELFKAGKDD